MSRSGSTTRGSGDPRKRAAAATAAVDHRVRRRWALVALIVACSGLVVTAAATLRPADDKADSRLRGAAAEACDLITKAEETAAVDTGARYAAAVLLLDRAIIESARAARSEPEYAELDRAAQALHTAGHRGGPKQWRDALDAALAECQGADQASSGGPVPAVPRRTT